MNMQNMISKMILVLLAPSFSFAAALVDPSLAQFLKGAQGKSIKVVVLMAYSQTGLTQPQRYNYKSVRQYLNSQVQGAWKDVSSQAQAAGLNLRGSNVRVNSVHWINNSFVAEVTPEGLRQLAGLTAIQKIYNDNRMTNDRPFASRRTDAFRQLGALPYDLAQMKMDQVYANYPQINGQGVFIGHIDTGVDGAHPGLSGKIHIFWNASTQKQEPPTDAQEHGTHTAGTLVGIGPNGGPMGVAPGAKLISSGALGDYAEMIRAMEFMLDPDGNPNTADFPRIVTNSWNCEGAPDLEAFYRGITAWEAAGILPVFSAGNAGPKPGSITKPHEHPSTLAIGALDQNARVASFSSRGPGIFNGQKTQKPDVAGPGVEIISTMPGGKYAAMSGTSMSTPHVAGLVALIEQANPKLNPAQIKELIMRSAVSVDEQGKPQPKAIWNPSYGFGVVDAFAALNMATGRNNMRKFSKSISPLDFLSQWDPGFETAPVTSTADITAKFITDESQWLKLQ